MIVDRLAPSTMEENPLWLVVLCDMMTMLMLFFLIMYVLSTQKVEQRRQFVQVFSDKGVIAPPPPAPPAPEVLEDDAGNKIAKLFFDAGLAESIEIVDTRDAVRVRLKERILFPTAGARLSPAAEGAITLLASILARMPNEVVVEGHTDSVPITKAEYESNWELSIARSHSVLDRLMAAGIAPRRLVAAGYGEFRPLATNETAEGRARNRRIEIVIERCPKGLISDLEFDCLGPPRGPGP